MSPNFRSILCLFAVVSLIPTVSLGAELPSSGSSSAVESSILDHLRLGYFANFHGTPLKDLGSSHSVGPKGTPSAYSVNFDGDLTGYYMVDDSTGIGPHVPFLLVPVRGQGIILGDVGIKAINNHTVSMNGFHLDTNVYVQAPTSDSSRARGMNLAVKTTPSLSYRASGSRLTIGSWTEAKTYLGVDRGTTFKLWAGPYLNYKVLPNFSLNLEYEMEWHHDVAMTGLHFHTYQTDLQPGFILNLSRKVMINPYMQIFTTQGAISSDRMAWGAVMSASIL
jgi:hypothetical protein